MTKDNDIKVFMAREINSGVSLNDLQKLVNEEFQTHYTFMDIRIMASELDSVDWKERDPKIQIVVEDVTKVQIPGHDAPVPGTVVEMSKIIRPGTLACGSVKFASGASGEWYVDQTGRLGLDKVDGKPTEQDVKDFQAELQKLF